MLWLGWCTIVVVFFLLGVLFVDRDSPYFDGFRVRIPLQCRLILSELELEMVIMHELGHKKHFHVWKNLLRMFVFFPATKAVRMRQELQADDYVTDPAALASALRKLSDHPFDISRAYRLEMRAIGKWNYLLLRT